MEAVEKFLTAASDLAWGYPPLILLFGTHLFLTLRLRSSLDENALNWRSLIPGVDTMSTTGP